MENDRTCPAPSLAEIGMVSIEDFDMDDIEDEDANWDEEEEETSVDDDEEDDGPTAPVNLVSAFRAAAYSELDLIIFIILWQLGEVEMVWYKQESWRNAR